MEREAGNGAADDLLGQEQNAARGGGKPSKRERLADDLESKAARLQELEDSPYKYTGKDGEPTKRELRTRKAKKAGIIGGGIAGAGLIGGVGLMSMSLGPLQLIHMSETLRGGASTARKRTAT